MTTTIDRLLISVLVAVLASTAVRWTHEPPMTDSRADDAVVLPFAGPTEVADTMTRFELVGFDPEVEAVIRDSIELFDEAGLDLPAIRFVSCDDPDDCRGRDGMVIHRSDGPELRLCEDEVTPVLEWVVIHELAHCWEKHEVTDEARQAFLDLRGLGGWREGAWHERGAEHAAEIMVWGLIDRPVRPGHINQNSCDELGAGYTTLTAQAPLHGYCDICP
jgi:hypothetical protein